MPPGRWDTCPCSNQVPAGVQTPSALPCYPDAQPGALCTRSSVTAAQHHLPTHLSPLRCSPIQQAPHHSSAQPRDAELPGCSPARWLNPTKRLHCGKAELPFLLPKHPRCCLLKRQEARADIALYVNEGGATSWGKLNAKPGPWFIKEDWLQLEGPVY